MRGMLVIDVATQSLVPLTTLLQSQGHQVILLEAPYDLDKVLQQHDISLVFMSLQCPHVDKLCEQLRQVAEGATLPLFLVGYQTAQVHSAMAAQQLGADGYLSLPLHKPDVLTLLHTYLGSQDTLQPKPADTPLPLYDTTKLTARIMQKFEQVHFANYLVILEISGEASLQVIEEAYKRLSAKFAPAAWPVAVEQRYHQELHDIAVVLREAYQVLACPTRRQRYLQSVCFDDRR